MQIVQIEEMPLQLAISRSRHVNIPDQPDQTFGGDVLAGLQFVQDKGLQGLRLCRSGLLALTDFLVGF